MIACKPQFPPYLSALLPQDQIFDPEDLEYDPRSQEHHASPPKKRIKSELKQEPTPTEETVETKEELSKNEESTSQTWDIDNPYLAATKLPSKGND